MEKDEVLALLDGIVKKYDALPEENRIYGFRNSPEEDAVYNWRTYPGRFMEVDKILRKLKGSPLLDDLDIGIEVVKIAPHMFEDLGEQARGNVAIFLEACRNGNIGSAFKSAGDNILESEEYMNMVMQIRPALFEEMTDEMKNNPRIATQFVKIGGHIPDGLEEDTVEYLRQANKEDITYNIVGMRTEKYIGTMCDGHNCDFEYYDTELERKIICCTKGDKKYEIALETSYGECPSGWTTASWGHMHVGSVEEFGEITHIPTQPTSFEFILDPDGFECDAFGVQYDGGDGYYPMGGAGVNMNLFKVKVPELSIDQDARTRFENSLLRDDVVEYFSSKTPAELEAEFGPEVARMVGFEQKNAHHCYDLWGHTLHTVEAVDTTGLSLEDAKKLRVAAFFHDIGKPDVVGFNPKTKQQNFFNHAVHSVDIARPILEKLGYTPEEIQQIGFFIGHHDDFINYKNQVPENQKSHAFFREINENTIAEIAIQNQYDWDKLGFPCYLPTHTGNQNVDEQNRKTNDTNKLKVRYICSTIANGVEPRFIGFKNAPIKVDVNMDEVMSKMATGEYDAEYVPTPEDYKLLLKLCRADARAQSEKVYSTDPRTQQETVVDSRDRKVKTFDAIDDDMHRGYYAAQRHIHKILERAPKDVKEAIEQFTGYSFEEFIEETKDAFKRPPMVLGDGVKMSVQASAYHYCEPRRSGLPSYESYEVGYPSAVIEQLREYAECPVEEDEELLTSVYPFVPAELLSQIVMEHGGIDKEATLNPDKKLDGFKQEKSGMEAKNQKAQDLVNQFMAQLGNLLYSDDKEVK